MRLEGAALSVSESPETCFGVAPNRHAFAARSAQLELHVTVQARRIERRPQGLEDLHAASTPCLHWRARQELNLVPKFWRLRCDASLGPVALPTGVEPVSPLRQRGCDTSRIRQHSNSRAIRVEWGAMGVAGRRGDRALALSFTLALAAGCAKAPPATQQRKDYPTVPEAG